MAGWLENAFSMLTLNLQPIILSIVIAFVTYLMFRQSKGFFGWLQETKKMPSKLKETVEPLVKYIIAFVGTLLFMIQISYIISLSEYAFSLVPSILTAAIIVASTWIFLQLSKSFFSGLIKANKIPADILHTVEMVTKYSIIIAGLVLSIINVLSGLGYIYTIESLILAWLVANAGRITLIVAALIFTKIASKLISTFFGDYKQKTTVQNKFSELAGTGARYILYLIVGLIIFSTLLTMIGAPELTPLITNLFSVLVGVGLSFAAAGAIGNIISGLILINWKPYKTGDRVEIGGTNYGDVTDFDVMFTRIQTTTNETIHVPNSLVLNNKITNYKPKCLVHPRVSVAYNIDRKAVEDILIKAALKTDGIVCDPAPSVYVTELGKNYIEYELRACTNEPNRLVEQYSDVQKNILDLFGEANIDLMIPQYSLDASLYMMNNEKRKK